MNHQADRLQDKLLLQTVLQTVLDGLLVIDAKGTIQSFNAAAVKIFGYEPEEVIGRNVKMLMPEPYHSSHDTYLHNYLTTGEKKVIGIGREVTARRKDGIVFPMELGINEMQIEGRRMFVGTIRDITARKNAEAELKQMVDQLLESNTELERFAYIASHDMQEPIRMVTNFSEIVAKDYGHVLDDTGREYLNLVVNSGQRMRSLVEDLLAYSRVGNEGMHMAPFSGESALSGALENLKNLIDERNAEISFDPLPELYGNPVQFMRLVQNMITNAIKYQRKGNRPKIHIGVEDRQNEWLISVSDNGIGIKKEFAEQIFQPFRRLHTWDTIKGTGLGLAICRKIVENHGGRIWVDSLPGEGCVFYFTISKSSNQPSEAA